MMHLFILYIKLEPQILCMLLSLSTLRDSLTSARRILIQSLGTQYPGLLYTPLQESLPLTSFSETTTNAKAAAMSSAIGRSLAWIFQVDTNNPAKADPVSRGESVFSVQSADSYVEEEPTVGQWFAQFAPTGKGTARYFRNLFPIINWMPYYNLQWLAGDLVAGITIGAVVVPQGMAYAILANLRPEFGLYSAFFGVVVYPFLGTSKDITIGVSLSNLHAGE